ncbi:hypothetical protein D3C81_688420 [compost metagenome]
MSSALAQPVNDFFIRKDSSKCRAPVHRYFCDVSKTFVIELDKNPLCPFIIFRVRRTDLPIPIVGEAKRLNLAAEIVDILHGNMAGMFTRIQRMLLSRKTESIPAHRMKHVISAHPLVTGDDICGSVAFRVTYVKTST